MRQSWWNQYATLPFQHQNLPKLLEKKVKCLCFPTSFHFCHVSPLYIQAQEWIVASELPQRRSAYAMMQARGQIYLKDEDTA